MEDIRKVLDSDAKIVVEYDDNSTNVEKIVDKVDNRFEDIKHIIDSFENKDDNFHTELIRLLSFYINQIYDREVISCNKIVLNKEREIISENNCFSNSKYVFELKKLNRKLSNDLFVYVCEILKNNKNITLDIEILKRLLNRNPRLFALSVEEDYRYRMFDFSELSEILKENQTLKKSNITIDCVYQLLIDTYQIDNEDVFTQLINPEEFKENHQKINEFLAICNAITFTKITNIIINYFDKDFDRLTIAKKRNTNNFCERVIIELLTSHCDVSDYNFIHNLLRDESIGINYNYYYADYFGQTSLKDLIALSGNKTIIKDLLSKEKNIQNSYWHGESKIRLYELYAIIGEYEKALTIFRQNYNYSSDFTEDFMEGFNEEGYARGDWYYSDSLVNFIKSICKSLENDDIEYLAKRNLLSCILDSENVKYINLEETLPIFQQILTQEDFQFLLDALTEKYNAGKLGFTVVNEIGGFYERYAIKIANAEQVQEVLSTLKKQNGNKVLSLKNMP